MITWIDVADWRTKRLFPVVDKLMRHREEPYYGDLQRCMRQACVRLMASDRDKRMAEITYQELAGL